MTFSLPQNSRDVSLVICGEAGQGIQTLETLITRSAKLTGYHIFSSKEYMSRVRGGSNSSEIRISTDRVHAFVERIDLLLPMTGLSAERLKERISKETLIIGEAGFINEELRVKCGLFIELPFAKLAKELGKSIFSNQIALGLVAKLFNLDMSVIKKRLTVLFTKKGAAVLDANVLAVQTGYDICARLVEEGKVTLDMEKPKVVSGDIVVSGADAVGLGAVAGGCDFVAAYPMSPSTGVLTFLSRHAEKFGIVAEQCEDEIAGINMALGAWYAGSRALASTSGGGFALMEEGVSLCAMIESPLVIHIAQRPGPATGLPTRTEQGDLELALYSGHGEFPRIILTPGSAAEAFYLTQRAFNMAAKYQVPVFILTDQYLMDSVVNIPSFELESLEVEKGIVKTDAQYKRYAFTKSGLSPRGIPGFGNGFVAVDSDEHDEEGRITEEMDIRVKMVDKRLKKLELIKNDIVPPTLLGDKRAGTVILGWGSTLEIAREALSKIKNKNVLFVHNSQPYPMHPITAGYIEGAKKVAVVEGNATGQYARLVKLETGREVDRRILKYNGLQFSVEELVKRIGEL